MNPTKGSIKAKARRSERGNIFFTLFAAVAVVGVLGAAVMTLMRGPLSTMVEVNRRTQAEAQMAIASKLALLEAVSQPGSGDCEATPDGYVEPLEWADASGNGPDGVAGSDGGGFLPASIGVTKTDPWGTEYGYCVWDAGVVFDDAACGGAGQKRLEGNGQDDRTYTVIALISAGPDRTFQSGCLDYDTADGNNDNDLVDAGDKALVDKAAGSDDIVFEFTYDDARGQTGGLWNLKAGAPNTAEISKDLEVTGGASFSGNVDLSASPSAQLKLGAASMLIPDQADLATCNLANVSLVRINNTTDPDTLEICDDASDAGTGPFTWVSVALGAAGINLWKNDGPGGPGEIYYSSGLVGIGTNDPDDALDIVGVLGVTDNIEMSNTKSVVWASGASIAENTGSLQINANAGAGVELTVGASTVTILGDTAITGSTTDNTKAALDVKDSGGGALLYVRNDGKVGIKDAAPNDELDVNGAIDLTSYYKIDGNIVLNSDGTRTQTILVGKDAGADVTGDFNTVVGAGAAATLDDGEGNIIIGAGSSTTGVEIPDVPAADTDDYLNIGNVIFGDLENKRIGIGFGDAYDTAGLNDALEVSGNIDATGSVSGNSVSSDTTVSATTDITAGGDITAGDTITADFFKIDGVTGNFGPAPNCDADEKLDFDGLNGWACIADLQGGSGGLGQNLEEVLTIGNDAGGLDASDFDQLGADEICNEDLTLCFDPETVANGGLSSKLSSITAADNTNTIANGDNAQIWNWTLTTAGKSAFSFGETAAATNGVGAQSIVKMSTAALSTAMPLWIYNLGEAHSFRVDDVAGDTTPFAIDKDGNVGIGTASPTTVLHAVSTLETVATFEGLLGDVGRDTTINLGGGLGIGEKYVTYQNADSGANAWLVGMGDNEQFFFFYGAPGEIDEAGAPIIITQTGQIGIGDVTPNDGSGGGGQNLKLDVEGATGSAYYCDENGLNCFTATSIAGSGIWERNGTVVRTRSPVDHTTDDLVFGSTQLADIGAGVTTDDARLFFDKSKAAFRAGASEGGTWDDGVVGSYSTAFGLANTASNTYATALGAYSTASGNGSLAAGVITTASGPQSIAMGNRVTVSGTRSFGLGLAGSPTGVFPILSGSGSLGIFMGDQDTVNVTANNIFALLGGRIVVDPDTTSATHTNVSTGVQQLELDVEGDIGAVNYCDEAGNNCFTPAQVYNGNARLSAILAANADNTIDSAAWNQVWNWDLTAAETGFTFGESGASSGGGAADQHILAAKTLATSTAIPFYIENVGAGASFRVDDASGDTTPFLIAADGQVTTGTHLTVGNFGNLYMSPGSYINWNSSSASIRGGATYMEFNINGVVSMYVNSSRNVGIGTATPSYLLSLDGAADRTIGMERIGGAGTDGSSLTILSGGAQGGTNDSNGGDLILSSATATGDGSSSIIFKTVLPGQGAGTTDRAPVTSMTLASNALTLPSGPTTEQPGQAGMQASVAGMIRYDTTANKYQAYQNGAWQDIITSGAGGISIGIDNLTDAVYDTTGDHNMVLGSNTAPTAGAIENVWIGEGAGKSTTNAADRNTAVGYNALHANTTAFDNTAFGNNAMLSTTTGVYNTAIGASTLSWNTGGVANTAVGYAALNNTTGWYNTGIGSQALAALTSGNYNTGLGYQVGNATISTGSHNILIGTDSTTTTPANNTSHFLNLGNIIYATNLQNIDNTGGIASVGIGTVAPSYLLSLDGEADRTIGMERTAVADTDGFDLTLLAGGGTSGDDDLDGGTLNLSSGIATGDGMSSIVFKTVKPGQGTGSTDRLPAASMTLASNALTLPSGPTTEQPGQAGMQASVNGMIRYDTTSGKFQAYQQNAWQDIITSGAGGVSTKLNGITAADGTATIANGDNAIFWNWATTTAGKDAFTFGETTASTATGESSILKAATLATSTATPLMVTNLGAANSFRVNDETGDNDATPFVIAADGKVGVGTASPTAHLHVVNAATPTMITVASTAGANPRAGISLVTSSTWLIENAGNNFGELAVQYSGSPVFQIATNGRLGVGGGFSAGLQPSYNISMLGNAAKTIGMERMSAAGAGNDLTILAGGAHAGDTDTDGGDLILSAGTSTGNNGSLISMKVAVGSQGNGTTDRAPQEIMKLRGDQYSVQWQTGDAVAFASTAWGDATRAAGGYATAFGMFTDATATSATAWGNASLAAGEGSTAWGGYYNGGMQGGIASGVSSTAFGIEAKAGSGTGGDGAGDYSLAIGLGDSSAADDTEYPKVEGVGSIGLFMGDQKNVNISANNIMALLGGRFVIDPDTTSAANVNVSTGAQQLELDVQGDIGAVNYCDEAGNNCFTAAGILTGVTPRLNSIIAANNTATIANGDNAINWNWATTTAGIDAFTFGETTASTASGESSILKAATLATSTATPLMVTNLGDANSFRVNDETGDNDATPFVIDASGNVGIGVGTPYNNLSIGSATAGGSIGMGYGGAIKWKTTAGADSGNNLSISDYYTAIGTNYWLTLGGINESGGAASKHFPLAVSGNNYLLYNWPWSADAGYNIGSSVGFGRWDGGNITNVQALYNTGTAALGSGATISFVVNRTTGGHTPLGRIGAVATNIGNATYTGDMVFYTANAAAPNEKMRLTSGGNLGIGTTAPSYLLSLDGEVDRTIGMERTAVADTDGFDLTVLAGGGTSGDDDLDGGTLNLSSGIATGDGMSSIVFKTVKPGQGTGSTDRLPAASMVVASNALTIPGGPTTEQPGQAGMQASVEGMIRYDTTTDKFQAYQASAWQDIITSGAGGVSTKLNGIIAADNTATIANGDNAIFWNWATTTAGKDAFTFGETTASTATGESSILKAATLATSTATPLMITNLGAANSFRVNDETGDNDATPFVIDAAGNVAVGAATAGAGLDVLAARTASGANAYGARLQQTLTAAANNDTLTGLYINPTFDDNGRTGVKHSALTINAGTGWAYNNSNAVQALRIVNSGGYGDGIGFSSDANNGYLWHTGNSDSWVGNAGSFVFAGNFTGSASDIDMVITNSGRVGILSNQPSYILSLGGNAARTIGMERHTTADTAGNSLTVLAGGATTGATDKNGGNLILQSGQATGTGRSSIVLRAPEQWVGSGTADPTFGDIAEFNSWGSIRLGFNTAIDSAYSFAAGYGLYVNSPGGGYTIGRTTNITGSYSFGLGLGFTGNGAGDVHNPTVSGDESLGIFMGDQTDVDVSADNIMALLGGRLVIDPDNTSAANTNVSTGVQQLELDVQGDIGAVNYCDEAGNNCFTAATAAAGGSAKLNSILAADNTATIASGDNAILWNWATTTAGKDAFTFGETTASTASGESSILKAATLATSTATPLMVTNLGAANSFRVNDETGDNDATPFVIDAAGNVGIGTASPQDVLDVVGNVRAFGGNGFRFGGAGSAGMWGNGWNAGADELVFKTAATTRMYIDNGGNLGIGTVVPTYLLSLGGEAARTVGMEREATADTAGRNLTVLAGGASSGASDKAGGDLVLSAGVGTGTGTSKIFFQASPGAEGTDTDDNTLAEIGRVTGGGFVQFTGTYGAGDTMAVATGSATPGNGTRMFWYPRKAAFRAGEVTCCGAWDDALIGTHSTAFGVDSFAQGDISMAWGQGTAATNIQSTAWGSGSRASGQRATAWGYYSLASAYEATAFGTNAQAEGDFSMAFGYQVATGAVGVPGSTGYHSLAVGLGPNTAADNTEYPRIEGNNSFGIFMGDQKNVNISANNIMALLGGRLVIDPDTTSAANVNVSTGAQQLEVDVQGDIGAVNYCDEAGNNCFTAATAAAGGSAKLNSILAADNTATIASGDNAILWNWATTTAGKDAFTFGETTASTASGESSILKAATLATSTATPLMVTNLGAANSFRVNDETGDNDATPFIVDASGNLIVGSTQMDDAGSAAQDNRLFFNKTKGAFRAGISTGTRWDDANIGTGSVAFGNDTQATGSYSTALGNETLVTGNRSTAMGQYVQVTNSNSMGIGLGNSSSSPSASVTGTGALTIFMQDQSNVSFTSNDTLALIGGKMFIEPAQRGGGGAVSISGGTYDLGFSGQAARTIGMERHSTADTAGNNLTVLAGGATTGATDKNGGTLILSGGTATGNGYSNIIMQVTEGGNGAGTADGPVEQMMKIAGQNGSVAIGRSTSAPGLYSSAFGLGLTVDGDRNTAFGTKVNMDSAAGYSMGIGLGDTGLAPGDAGNPTVSGDSSFGVFMGDQSNVNIAANNIMAVLGGRIVLDPDTTSAANVNVSTGAQQLELDVQGDIGAVNYCDEAGNNCFTAATAAAGGTSALSAITAATAANAISSGDNAQLWKWTLTTAAKSGMEFGENAAATNGVAAQSVVKMSTLATSTAMPLWISNLGAAHSFRVDDVAGDTTPFVIDAAGNVSAGGNITLTDANYKVTSTGTELVLEQTGDTLGATRMYLQNRGGSNGAIFENATLDLVDFGFLTASATQMNIRFEKRNGVALAANGANGELEFIPTSAGPNPFARFGEGTTALMSTRLGIQTTLPSYDVGIGGDAARTIGMERHTTADTAGNSLTVQAGGATSGATDKNGGDLILSGGISTGTGDSDVYLKGYKNGSQINLASFNANLESMAVGNSTTASGFNSVAAGDGTTASNYRATAFGNYNTSSGINAMAWGNGNTASGDTSTVWGVLNVASGDWSTTFGREAKASGNYTVAIGLGDNTAADTTEYPTVSGANSYAIFMGDQKNVNISANNIMALLGGRLVIDPDTTSAANVNVSTGAQQLELDVQGDIGAVNYCDEAGNNCFTAATAAAGGSAKLNSILAADNTATIANGDNAILWNWATTTAEKDAFTFGETTASTATGESSILKAATLATSTATPLMVTNLGAANSFRVNDETGDNDATPFVIAADGKVGIGVTTPLDPLSIGTTPISGTGHALLNLSNTALVGGGVSQPSPSANGSYIGINPAAFTGDFVNFEIADRNYYRIAPNLFDMGSTLTSGTTFMRLRSGWPSDVTLSFYDAASTGRDIFGFYYDRVNSRLQLRGDNGASLGNILSSMTVGGNYGLGVAAPTYMLSLNGNAARTIGMELHTTADTAGNSLTVLAGGATSGATNKNGGDLILSGGIATGTGDSNVTVKGYQNGSQVNLLSFNSNLLSSAFGPNTASGSYSMAWGNSNTASGNYSTVWGGLSVASGSYAVAGGNGSYAYGQSSMALGTTMRATGLYSTAIGLEAMTGDGTVGGGNDGDYSIALGLGDASTATYPTVTGSSSFGIFMGDQQAVDISASNIMALLGGRLVIDPDTTSAANVNVSTGAQQLELDVQGDIGAVNYCDEAGNNCFTAATAAAGGSAKLNSILAADNTATIANGDNAILWNWATTTAGKDAFTFGETTASTASGESSILKAATLATSTATPLMVTNLGAANSFRVNDETGDNDTTPFVIAADGDVGIGTATPTYQLEVVGAGASFTVDQGVGGFTRPDGFNSGSALVSIQNNDATNGESSGLSIWAGNGGSDYPLRVQASGGGAELLAVRGDGNVGIGIATPSVKLQVRGTDMADATNQVGLEVESVGNCAAMNNMGNFARIGAGDQYTMIGGVRTACDNGMDFVIRHTYTSGTETESFRITETGNVGIGTSGPASKLHLYNNGNAGLTIEGDDGNHSTLEMLSLGDGTKALGDAATKGWQQVVRGNAYGAAAQRNDFIFAYWDGSTWYDRFYIDAATGYTGIGIATPSSMLDVNGAFTMRELAAPAVSASDTGRIYFDSTANKFKVSEHGGAYVDLVGGGTPGGADTQVQFNDGGAFGGDADYTWNKTTNVLSVTGKISVSDRVSISPTTGAAAPSVIALNSLSDVDTTGVANGNCLVYNGTDWVDGACGSSSTLNGITAATGNQAGIANGAYTIVWNWDALTNGSAMKFATSGTTATDGQKMLEIALTGANATGGATTYGTYITNTHSGGTSTNVGLYASASGGTTANYAALFAAGNVGIGTTAPSGALQIGATGSTANNNIYITNGLNVASGNIQSTVEHNTGSNSYSGAVSAFIAGNDTKGAFHAVLGNNNASRNQYALIGIRNKANGTWTATPTAVVSGDYLPGIGFAGTTNTTAGTGVILGASFQGVVDNTVSTGVLPTALVFNTSVTDSTGLTERMRISSTGNVGIGTTAPGTKLHVVHDSYPTTRFERIAGSSAGGTSGWTASELLATANSDTITDGFGPLMVFGMKNNSGTIFSLGEIDGYRDGADLNGGLRFHTYNGGSEIERMRITSAGNVGIGATSPGAKLTVGDGATAAGVIRIMEDTDDGSNYASFTVPALAANTVYTLPPDDGTSGQVLRTDGSGVLTWVTAGGSPAGADTQVQFNDGGSFGGDADYTWNKTTNVLTLTGSASISSSVTIGSTTGAAAPTQLALADLSTVTISSPSNGQVLSYNGSAWVNSAASGGATLNGITAATASQAGIANAAYSVVWNWALTGATADAFTFGETTAATGGSGDQSILKTTTLASSTAIPLMVTNLGNAISFRVNDATSDTDTTPFVVDAAGNVGIGIASPQGRLNIETGDIVLTDNSGGSNGIYFSETGGAGNTYGAHLYNDATNNIFKIDVGDASESTYFSIVRATGSVGIGGGATSPTGTLYVAAPATTLASAAGAEYTTGTFAAPTITFTGTSNVTSQMDSFLFTPQTFAGTAATVSDATTMTIDGAPVKGGSVVVTNTHALKINTRAVSTATNSYGLYVDAMTGATNNYAAVFATGNVGIGTTAPGANLVIGNGSTSAGVLRLNEDTDDGSNYASFTVPALAANTVYTLPPDDGTSGQVLRTDGSGVLTWVTAGGSPAGADTQVQFNDGGSFG
ncbi:MAG: hypothetical protein IT558_03865, partial [Alphaproteobacteria bacterium]|nr:hypothetical protein [Alphaproteobacteria bacterium]